MRFFRKLYLALFKWWTFLLLRKAAKCVHKLMLMLGKNPNYVAPKPSPASFVDNLSRLKDEEIPWSIDHKKRSAQWIGVISDNCSGFVKDVKEHPVLKSRELFAAKQKAAEEARKSKQAPPAETTEVVEYTEVGTPSLEQLKSVVSDIEKSIKEQN